jgi:hypothetical protein
LTNAKGSRTVDNGKDDKKRGKELVHFVDGEAFSID